MARVLLGLVPGPGGRSPLTVVEFGIPPLGGPLVGDQRPPYGPSSGRWHVRCPPLSEIGRAPHSWQVVHRDSVVRRLGGTVSGRLQLPVGGRPCVRCRNRPRSPRCYPASWLVERRLQSAWLPRQRGDHRGKHWRSGVASSPRLRLWVGSVKVSKEL